MILILGIAIPEIVKRRRTAELKKRIVELEKETPEATSEIALLRRELTLMLTWLRLDIKEIPTTTWQAGAVFCTILVAIISALM